MSSASRFLGLNCSINGLPVNGPTGLNGSVLSPSGANPTLGVNGSSLFIQATTNNNNNNNTNQNHHQINHNKTNVMNPVNTDKSNTINPVNIIGNHENIVNPNSLTKWTNISPISSSSSSSSSVSSLSPLSSSS